MKKQWFLGLVLSAFITSLNADCTNMPTGSDLTKSIESKNIDQAKTLLQTFQSDVKKFLASCKDEGKQQEVSILKLTLEDEVKFLEVRLKKGDASFDCSKVPDDTALNSAFASKDGAKIEKEYQSYHKNAEGYLEHCASHEEYEAVFEASMLHDDEYTNWKSSVK